MTPDAPSRIQVAYHEAAHAVVATLLEIPVWYVTIRQKGEQFGHVREFGAALECDTWRHLIVSMAGREAARRVTREDVTKHAAADLYREDVLLSTVPEDQREATRASAAALTMARVQEHWSWIENVAKELLAKSQVVGSRVKELKP